MSYLMMSHGIGDFDKAVISLWFRVPQQSVTAAAAAYNPVFDEPIIFNGIIPLVIFGNKGSHTPNETTHTKAPLTVSDGVVIQYVDVSNTESIEAVPTTPSFIGVDCSQTDIKLCVNFETGVKPEAADYLFELRSVEPAIIVGGVAVSKAVFHSVDISDVALTLTGAVISSEIPVSADKWHHVLISVEINDIVTHGRAIGEPPPDPLAVNVDSASRLFVALDDVNYTRDDLSVNWPDGSSDDNAIITKEAGKVAATAQETLSGTTLSGIPRYSLAGMKTATTNFGFPGSPEFVHNIYRVEMAEFQMWLGRTLDTSMEKNRRAFVDADGKPVPPDKKASAADPASGSIEYLGKKPDILLHGSSNWIDGKNTGFLGVDADGNVILGGQFVPTGGIEKYTPDPSLDPHARL